jgi:hypothetical protein
MADKISPEMRKRLLSNRQGKLTTQQWMDMITEPLVPVLLLIAPVIVILGPRALVFGWTACIAGLGVFAVLAIVSLYRARRYARMPVHFALATLSEGSVPLWKFWQPPVMQTDLGEQLRFNRWIAPKLRIQRNRPYLVYYFKEAEGCVLLSAAPADHPEVEQWKPGEMFAARLKQRTS